MDDNKYWLYLWTMIAACITTIILGAICITSFYDVKMAELGYERVMLPGSSVAHWQKSVK